MTYGLQDEFDNYDDWLQEKHSGVDSMANGLTYNDYREEHNYYVLPEYSIILQHGWAGQLLTSFNHTTALSHFY